MPKVGRTFTFKGVEIARIGTFEAQTGKVTLTIKDFDNAQEAYEALKEKHHAAVKLGHDEHQRLLQKDGYPNAGFVENIRRDGDRLLADLVDVPEAVAELIKSGRYRSRSIEAIRNFDVDGKKWPFVITGLALLGADLPAIDSLEDVAAVYATQGLEYPDGEPVIVIFASEAKPEDQDSFESLIEEFRDMLNKIDKVIYRRGGAPKFRALEKAAIDELKSIVKNKKAGGKEMDLTKLVDLLGLEKDATEEAVFASLNELKAKASAASDGDTISKLRSDLAEAQKRIVALEAEGATERAQRDVDAAIKAGKFAPASRETLVKMAIGSPTEFGELIQATPENAILAGREIGSDNSPERELGDLEPTKTELEIAAKTGLTREDLIAAKAQARGVVVPADVAKVLAERRK